MLLEPQHSTLSIRRQCEILGINRSSIYYVPRLKKFDEEKLVLMRLVDETYTKYPFFGTRQMTNYLKLNNHHVARHQIRWVYEQLGLKSLAPGPHTSKGHPEHKIYPYLLRDVDILNPNHVWSSDITYIRLRRGFVYLVAIIDWFSRYVLDWELSISLDADFCIDTLKRVLAMGQCDIFNTDQGSQFTSKDFTGLLGANGIKISMDGKGRALDNVFVERLWRSVKYECVYLHEWGSMLEARRALKEYFDFYNNERPHQGLDGRTPASVHMRGIH